MKASLKKIVWNDWLALFAFCALPIIWIIHFAFPYLKRGASAPIEVGVIVSILAAVALAWRIRRVQQLFATGAHTDGVVEAVRILKDRGRLEYSYHVDGRSIGSWSPVHKSKQVLALRIGQKITVLFDRKHPEKSIVADLFLAP